MAKGGQVGGIVEKDSRAGRDRFAMPPTSEATTALDFHMASATVSPNPSAKLFWTITVAWR